MKAEEYLKDKREFYVFGTNNPYISKERVEKLMDGFGNHQLTELKKKVEELLKNANRLGVLGPRGRQQQLAKSDAYNIILSLIDEMK